MERRTARISKEPEVRRQEILDTAMDVFMEKGYEAATMRDIAAAMHVVPGLCYRYFESKQVLYDAVVRQYVRDITAPMILLLEEEDDTLDGFLDRMQGHFCGMDGSERYHLFFHKKENHSLHQLLSAQLCEALKPYMEKKTLSNEQKRIDGRGVHTHGGLLPIIRGMACNPGWRVFNPGEGKRDTRFDGTVAETKVAI